MVTWLKSQGRRTPVEIRRAGKCAKYCVLVWLMQVCSTVHAHANVRFVDAKCVACGAFQCLLKTCCLNICFSMGMLCTVKCSIPHFLGQSRSCHHLQKSPSDHVSKLVVPTLYDAVFQCKCDHHYGGDKKHINHTALFSKVSRSYKSSETLGKPARGSGRPLAFSRTSATRRPLRPTEQGSGWREPRWQRSTRIKRLQTISATQSSQMRRSKRNKRSSIQMQKETRPCRI